MKIQKIILSFLLITQIPVIASDQHTHSHGGGSDCCSTPLLLKSGSETDARLRNIFETSRPKSFVAQLKADLAQGPYNWTNNKWLGFATLILVINPLSARIANEGPSAIPGYSWLKMKLLGNNAKRSHGESFNGAVHLQLLEHAKQQMLTWGIKIEEYKREEADLLERIKASSVSANHNKLNEELENIRRKKLAPAVQARDEALAFHTILMHEARENRAQLVASQPMTVMHSAQLNRPALMQHQHGPGCGHGHSHAH